MDVLQYKYLSIAGGGLAGKLYVGALLAIDDHLKANGACEGVRQWARELRGVAGCSAGAVMAICVLIGLSLHDLSELCVMGSQLSCFLRRPDPGMLAEHYGLDDASGVYDLIGEALRRAGLARDITLGGLHRYIGRDLVVVASNIQTSEKLYLSHKTHPDMTVCDAIVASCSIPFVYTPLVLGPGMTLCDGGLTENEPVLFPTEETLNLSMYYSRSSGFTIPPYKLRGVIPFAAAVFRTSNSHQKNRFDPRHTLFCVTPGTENTIDAFSFTDENEIELKDNLKRVRLFVADQLTGRWKVRSLGSVAVIVTALRLALSGHESCTGASCTPRPWS